MTMDHQAAADAGAEDYAEHIVGALAGAVDRLGEGETISVIGQAHRPPQALAEIVGQRVADEPSRIGVLDQIGFPRGGAGDTDANAHLAAQFALGLGDHVGEAVQRRGIAALGGWPAAAD